MPYLFRQNLYYTFYFDLMGDRTYKPKFEKARGKYLEQKVAQYLSRVFPDSAVLLNPNYPDGNEFSDVLVLHDGKIIIVQCKGKTLTRQAHIGLNADAIRSDIQKAVKDAIDQGVKCRKYLEASDKASLVYRGTPLTIDMEQVTEIEIIALTFMPLHTMATRIREVEKDLGMPHSEFSGWAVALGDLDIVTDICHSPARFLQYIRRRLLLEKGDVRVHGDEMDLLGFFLRQGLWMKDERFAETNILGISGFSNEIDEYVFRRWDCNETLKKPSVERPEGFYDLIDGIEKLDQFHRTDCAITLLETSSICSEKLMSMVKLTKQKTREDGKSHSISLQGKTDEGLPGISFQAFQADAEPTFVYQRTHGFGTIKKYAEKLDTWVALGWIQNSKSQVDRAFWLSFPWMYQYQLEEVASKLRTGRQT